MTEAQAHGPIKRIQIEATVIRADGTVEPLGLIADSKWRWWNPLGVVRSRRATQRIQTLNRLHGKE